MNKTTRLGLDFYLEQQCIFADIAFNDLNTELRKSTINIDRVWYSVHGFLTAVANIRKTFDPDKDRQRGKELRTDYGINPQNRFMDGAMKEIRNAMEHHDERFEKWVREHPGMGYASFSLKIGQIPVVSGDLDLFTLFVPSLTVTYRGTKLELTPFHEEAVKLIPKIAAHYKGLMNPDHPDKVVDGSAANTVGKARGV
jgi:hypothetical protein